MKSETVERWIRRCILVYPVLLPVALYGTWVIARLSLGRWPRPSIDDPKYINMVVSCAHSFVAYLLFFGLPIFVVLAVFALVWGLLRSIRKQPHGMRLAGCACLSMVLMVLTICLLYWDPLSVCNWFGDWSEPAMCNAGAESSLRTGSEMPVGPKKALFWLAFAHFLSCVAPKERSTDVPFLA